MAKNTFSPSCQVKEGGKLGENHNIDNNLLTLAVVDSPAELPTM